MASDCMEHFVDYSSDKDSNESCNHDSKEDHGIEEVNASENMETTELENIAELSAADFWKKEFECEEKAYEMYVKYARCVGFGVRKGEVSRDGNGNIIRRKFLCSRAGLREQKHYLRVNRKRDHKPETRTNCLARLMVYLDKSTSTWKVWKIEEEHNHELMPLKFVHLISNHRRMTNANKAQIDSMHRYGIQTSHIMGFMAGQAGGYAGVGFSKKDLYNYIERQRRAKIVDGDASAAISYLEGKADAEPMTVARYSTTNEQCLGNLFWADGQSRVDYQYFRDVVAFDSTYKKNKYNKPLVIFSGTNHHRQTCIFGFALLDDERANTYRWLLEHFLDVMGNKQPTVVVTDGDEAMREAIKVVFPNSTHRLCAWHLQKNATANIKVPDFCREFKKCVYANFDHDEFEEHWHGMVQKFELQDNNWVKKAYQRKEMWATAYLRDKFCAGVRTTSRCEGINSFIKRFIKSRHSLLELVQNLDRVVREYRNNELVAQFYSINSDPVLTTGLDSIECGAAKVYTREIFKEVKKEMEGVATLLVVRCESISTTMIYKLCKFGKPNRIYKVLYDSNLEKLECQCQLWNSLGIPCSHIFCVMKHEHIPKLPEKMIMKRWTKDAKSYHHGAFEEHGDSDESFMLRYGALCYASSWMTFLGAKRFPYFCKTMDGICRMTKWLEHECGKLDISSSGAPANKIGDPVIARTKGAPPVRNKVNKQRCSRCKMLGHTKGNCVLFKGGNSEDTEDVIDFASESDDARNLAPSRNYEGDHNALESGPSMREECATSHTASPFGSGIRGTQICPSEQSKAVFGQSQVNHFYLAQNYPIQPHFVGPNGLLEQFPIGGPTYSHQQVGIP